MSSSMSIRAAAGILDRWLPREGFDPERTEGPARLTCGVWKSPRTYIILLRSKSRGIRIRSTPLLLDRTD